MVNMMNNRKPFNFIVVKLYTWIEELAELGEIAKVEPHVAYCAYVFGLQHRYTYVLRTIPSITEHLKRLDEAIDEFLIKHLLKDHSLAELEHIWISLPARLGGLGINTLRHEIKAT